MRSHDADGCYLMGIAPFIMVLSNSVGAACLWNVVYTLGAKQSTLFIPSLFDE
jgi:hypothetical protein|eukprot:COSAG06_NODE_60_length_27159_cov_57.986031_10_plen_53_part_00